jgi:hypothetical protein
MVIPSRVSQLSLTVLLVWAASSFSDAFSFSSPKAIVSRRLRPRLELPMLSHAGDPVCSDNGKFLSRRSLLQYTAAAASLLLIPVTPAFAAQRVSLEQNLYSILRVREATQQESRLIKSGKFKDVQRANVKLAIKFMIENYRLGDAFVAASSYLDGNERRVAAVEVGQSAVQDLYTILEYFDSADVQNLKVRHGEACMTACVGDI